MEFSILIKETPTDWMTVSIGVASFAAVLVSSFISYRAVRYATKATVSLERVRHLDERTYNVLFRILAPPPSSVILSKTLMELEPFLIELRTLLTPTTQSARALIELLSIESVATSDDFLSWQAKLQAAASEYINDIYHGVERNHWL